MLFFVPNGIPKGKVQASFDKARKRRHKKFLTGFAASQIHQVSLLIRLRVMSSECYLFTDNNNLRITELCELI